MAFPRVPLQAVLCLVLVAPLAAQSRPSPSYEQIGALIQGGLDALGRGDSAGYLKGTGQAFALAPQVPPVAYHHARAHAVVGNTDSALALLRRLAVEGAVVAHEAPADSAFARLRTSPRWREVAEQIEASRRPISTSTPAFELPERDLTAEGTAWDAKTRTLFLSSLYKRKIVAIGPDGTTRDFIEPGQDGIGPVVGIEVDPVRRGLWAASMVLSEAGIPLTDTTLMAHGLLFHYDVDTGRLRRRYVLRPGGGRRHGFNDVTVMPNGDVYLTDSSSGALYKLAAGAGAVVEVLAPGTYTFPNGITRSDDGRRLFVAHGAGVDRLEVGTGRRVRLTAPDTLNLGGIDGLAFYRNSLIAHQPSSFSRVVRLRLDQAQERIASWEILERHHPRFVQPTTGEVAGDRYYYIANAQLRRFRDGKILPWDSLSPVLVLKTELEGDTTKAGEPIKEAIRSGAAAVARDGRIVWAGSFGVTDAATGTPVRRETRFGIGSISKTITLTAAVALADAGRLDLDAPVERYLPDSAYRLIAAAPLAAQPGTTAFHVRSERGGFEPAPPFDPGFKLPGAGFLSTAEDLARFGMALLEPGLLSQRARRELFTPVALADGTPTRYALGFQVLEEDGRRLLLQSGGGPGIAAWLAIYPDEGLVVALLANATAAPLEDTVRRVARSFLTPPAPAPPPRPPRATAQARTPPAAP